MSQMIPIRLAEMACQAYEAELQKLRDENARLLKAGNGLVNCISSVDFDREACHRMMKLTPREIEAVEAWHRSKEGGQP